MDGHEVLAQVRAAATTASLGADDYLPKPAERADLLEAVRMRLQQQRAHAPRFDDAAPLQELGISPWEAETLLWMEQCKSNTDTGAICGISIGTVKKHTNHIFEKLGVERRASTTLRLLETCACWRLCPLSERDQCR